VHEDILDAIQGLLRFTQLMDLNLPDWRHAPSSQRGVRSSSPLSSTDRWAIGLHPADHTNAGKSPVTGKSPLIVAASRGYCEPGGSGRIRPVLHCPALARGARGGHPRGRADWPLIGIFAQRGKNRPSRLGVSRAQIPKIDGLDVHVRGLDEVEGTPVLDVKPCMREFEPRGEVRQPDWATELMRACY